MENEVNSSNGFEIGKCRAKIFNGANLIDCLAQKQAHLCDHSLSFGKGYFCKHPRRNEFIEITKKLQSDSNSTSGVSQSDNQE